MILNTKDHLAQSSSISSQHSVINPKRIKQRIKIYSHSLPIPIPIGNTTEMLNTHLADSQKIISGWAVEIKS